MKNKVSYLAIPYTWNAKRSFLIANKVAAKLMSEGKVVISPISHGHVIADHLEESRYNNDFWLKQDLTLLGLCDELIIILIGKDGIDLVSQSKGCTAELEYAKKFHIPIHYYKYNL
jgi:hypothetical protein